MDLCLRRVLAEEEWMQMGVGKTTLKLKRFTSKVSIALHMNNSQW